MIHYQIDANAAVQSVGPGGGKGANMNAIKGAVGGAIGGLFSKINKRDAGAASA